MKKMTKKEFIEKAEEALGTEHYNFIKTTYLSSHIKTIITCNIHGDFLVEPCNVLHHHSGCPLCRASHISKSKTSNTEEFIKKAKKIHNNEKYDYSLVDYKNSQTKIKIICLEHGVFEMTPNNFLKGEGCPKCSRK